METREELQTMLEEEEYHSAFLEKLLHVLYGEGWNKLTLSEAKRYKVVKR